MRAEDAINIHNRRTVSDEELYFNSQFGAEALYLDPGQVLWSNDPNKMIVTTVGSGVVISIHDAELKMGVLAHVLAPETLMSDFPHLEKSNAKLKRHAAEPIEEAINDMKRHGAAKGRIYIRMMGGSAMPYAKGDTGTHNSVFVREFITRKNLPIINEDLGGSYIRRVHFFPATGRCVRRILRRKPDFSLMQDVEAEYQLRTLNDL